MTDTRTGPVTGAQRTVESPRAGRGWRERAACRDVDPELFFPTADSGPARETQVAAAKAVCARCPVRAQCLVEALARIPYGICGGLTEHERRQLRHNPATRTGRSMRSPGRSATEEVLTDGPPPGMTAAERAGLGRRLLAAGRTRQQVGRVCGVCPRTVERWATTSPPDIRSPRTSGSGTSTTTSDAQTDRSRGGNRAPLPISHPTNPLAGTRAAEGHRG